MVTILILWKSAIARYNNLKNIYRKLGMSFNILYVRFPQVPYVMFSHT